MSRVRFPASPQTYTMDKKKIQYNTHTSVGGKWEIVATKDITLFYMHDKNRMMRNSIICSYDELQQLADLLKTLTETK
jgi:hypothetical protein